jgi:prepilin peptidase CpaA
MGCYLGGLAFAAGWDVCRRSIPNALNGAIALAGVGVVLFGAPENLISHGLVAMAILAAGVVLFACGVWGAGDAKLLAAASLVGGAEGLPTLVLGTAMVGGLLAVCFLGVRYVLKPSPAIQDLPYGVAIAAGAVFAFAATVPFLSGG